MTDRIAHAPVDRHWSEVAAEVVVTVGTAYLAGLCLAVAAANDQSVAIQLVLVVLGVGLVLGYGMWLLGGSGALLAATNLPLLILAGDATLVASGFLDLNGGASLLGPGLGGVLPPLLAVLAAAVGLVSGLALPGPRRLRGRHGARRASVNSAAVLSQGAVMERLRTASAVPAAPPAEPDSLWQDDSTDQDGLAPLPSDSPSSEQHLT